MSYVYQDPLEQGYTQFKLTKKQHNKLFEHRQIKWSDRYEYYYNDKYILLHCFANWKEILINTIMFPILLLFEGLRNTKEGLREMKELYNQKKYGMFRIDHIWKDSEKYKEIMEIIKG